VSVDQFESIYGLPLFQSNRPGPLSLARLVGIDKPAFTLVDTDAIDGLPDGLGTQRRRKAYAIKRFDCSNDGAIHTEGRAQGFSV
jgi:serine/threonine-protein kinase HipA